MFYLESPAYQPHEKDAEMIKAQAQTAEGRTRLNLDNMYLVMRSLKYKTDRFGYEIQEKDILRIGRMKFAVKEIGYSEESLALNTQLEEAKTRERGHSANSIYTNAASEEWDEFEEVDALTEAVEDENDENE